MAFELSGSMPRSLASSLQNCAHSQCSYVSVMLASQLRVSDILQQLVISSEIAGVVYVSFVLGITPRDSGPSSSQGLPCGLFACWFALLAFAAFQPLAVGLPRLFLQARRAAARFS